jgi:hypothetical protein
MDTFTYYRDPTTGLTKATKCQIRRIDEDYHQITFSIFLKELSCPITDAVEGVDILTQTLSGSLDNLLAAGLHRHPKIEFCDALIREKYAHWKAGVVISVDSNNDINNDISKTMLILRLYGSNVHLKVRLDSCFAFSYEYPYADLPKNSIANWETTNPQCLLNKHFLVDDLGSYAMYLDEKLIEIIGVYPYRYFH